MSLSKLPLLLLMGLLIGPWTAASAESCDDVLIRRAGFMVSKRAQLAATQLVTPEAFDSLRTGLTGQMRLLDRRLADFGTYEALDQWRKQEASKEVFEHGADSARAAIVAGTSEDSYSIQWKKCQMDSALSQPPPSLRGWLESLEPDKATVKFVAVAAGEAENPDPAAAPPQIIVEPWPSLSVGEPVVSRRPQGGFVVERLATLKRLSKDIRLAASSGNSRIYVVVPASPGTGPSSLPVTQGIDSPSRFTREPTNSVIHVETGRKLQCIETQANELFDLSTIRVTASSSAGYWEITTKTAQKICIGAGISEKGQFGLKSPYVVILRVDKLRVRAATD